MHSFVQHGGIHNWTTHAKSVHHPLKLPTLLTELVQCIASINSIHYQWYWWSVSISVCQIQICVDVHDKLTV